ncbi:MAG: MBL fold metallo-hydrolase [Vicinamibacterales bacterium]|jgi:ribonuclease BN (tRNA processing enzyme)|nr:MBL fold metallo-hydrolase [Acidobacteriota bacterium]MDP7295466.1 MBL fold metallo-hydrolase [Vicinamibacterales bacterium]|tara:strand:+ start:1270 stop:2277 length:1008 start_codon:yes stop_codon:yes gene_type:complete
MYMSLSCPGQPERATGTHRGRAVRIVRRLAAACALVAMASGLGPTSAQAPAGDRTPLPVDPDRTQVILLGTGTPFLDAAKVGASVAIVTGGVAYLVDLGPGAYLRTVEAAQRGVEALAWPTRLFLTHLHSDHVLDYADLLWALWWRREDGVTAYGPRGLAAMTAGLQTAFAEDIRMRNEGSQPIVTRGYVPEVHEIDGTLRFEDERVRVVGFPVCHDGQAAYGYRFETADRVVVVSGDTTYCDSAIEHAQDADILVHEIFSERGLVRRTEDWQAYHRAAHSSPAQVARIANAVRPGTLVLYHQLYFGVSDEELVEEVREAGYEGPLVSGQDLDVF